MSLVFTALTPHPPLLIPNIGKENLKKLEATKAAMEELEKSLYLTQPDTLIFITPHGKIFPNAFSINANPELSLDFKNFGDLATQGTFQTDLNLIADISNAAKNQDVPLILESDPFLDYGVGVPLFYLSRHLNGVKIISLNYSLLDLKKHFDFGYFLKDLIMDSSKRVAVIASGDLSHRLSNASPAGFSPSGKKFDETVMEAVRNKNTTGLINLDSKLCQEAGECGLRSLLILLGVLRNMNYNLKLLAYESPFGVGYLTVDFSLD